MSSFCIAAWPASVHAANDVTNNAAAATAAVQGDPKKKANGHFCNVLFFAGIAS